MNGVRSTGHSGARFNLHTGGGLCDLVGAPFVVGVAGGVAHPGVAIARFNEPGAISVPPIENA
jgi:hypothetical protein